MAAKNGAPIHITAFGNTAMPIRRDTCRYRLGQENATQQYQKDDEDFSHNGTVPQEPTGHERPAEQEHPIVDPLFNPLLVSGHPLRGLRTIGPELEQDNVHENSLLLIAISELESVVYFCDAP